MHGSCGDGKSGFRTHEVWAEACRIAVIRLGLDSETDSEACSDQDRSEDKAAGSTATERNDEASGRVINQRSDFLRTMHARRLQYA